MGEALATIQVEEAQDIILVEGDLVTTQGAEDLGIILAGMVVILKEEKVDGEGETLDSTQAGTGVVVTILVVAVVVGEQEEEGLSHQCITLVRVSEIFQEVLVTQWEGQDTLQEGQDTTQVVDTQEDTALQVCVLVTSAVAWLIITAAWVVSSAIHTMNNSARGWTGQDVR